MGKAKPYNSEKRISIGGKLQIGTPMSKKVENKKVHIKSKHMGKGSM